MRVLFCLLLLSSPVFAAPKRFASPQGRWQVAFEPQERRFYSNPKARPLPSDTKVWLYRVQFLTPGRDTPVAVTYFTDIRPAPDNADPTPLDRVVSDIVWNPAETLAVLPPEQWPTADGSAPARQAVSLDPMSSWQTADFPFDGYEFIWDPDGRPVGNRSQGCRRDVVSFDPSTGKTSLVQAADPPSGFIIAAATKEAITMKKVLGSCATETDRREFRQECMTLDLRFGRRQLQPCEP